MDEDTSNDVEAVEYIDSQDEDDPDGAEKRPIMLLLRRLIRNKQNTVMTNAQIINILQSEFGILVNSSHELEVDIYIKIIKKYLKDWPQWEELERISTKLSNINDFDAVTKVLEHKYKNLKEYLGAMLEAAKPLAKEAVKNIEAEKKVSDETIDKSDVVMEITCSRDQLLQLFYRTPRLDLNNSVFNIIKHQPTQISLAALNFKQVLNFWCGKVCIYLPNLVFSREIKYFFKHTLVNKARNENTVTNTLVDTTSLVRIKPHTLRVEVSKDLIFEQFQEILRQTNNNELLKTVFEVCVKDINDMSGVCYIPAAYKRFANKYMYVRHHYVETDQQRDPKYDLQLQEMIYPSFQLYIGKVTKSQAPLPPLDSWFRIECVLCKSCFVGAAASTLLNLVTQHFNDTHSNETGWQCTHCRKTFDMRQLADSRWQHECWM